VLRFLRKPNLGNFFVEKLANLSYDSMGHKNGPLDKLFPSN